MTNHPERDRIPSRRHEGSINFIIWLSYSGATQWATYPPCGATFLSRSRLLELSINLDFSLYRYVIPGKLLIAIEQRKRRHVVAVHGWRSENCGKFHKCWIKHKTLRFFTQSKKFASLIPTFPQKSCQCQRCSAHGDVGGPEGARPRTTTNDHARPRTTTH